MKNGRNLTLVFPRKIGKTGLIKHAFQQIKEGKVAQPQLSSFVQQNELTSPSSVRKALAVLTDKDLVCHTTEGNIVYGCFFDLWLKRLR